MKTRTSAALAASLVAGLLAPPPASAADVLPTPSLVATAEALCAADPTSADCALIERQLVETVVSALYALGQSGRRQEVVATVRDYADWRFPQVREAVAITLGALRPTAEDTPVLARLLNDPVPAVRRAAYGALNASDDPAARRLVARAAWPEGDYEPDPSPVERLALTFALPEGSEPLYFADDAKDGVQAFVTDRAPAELLDHFAGLAGRPVLNLDALQAKIAATWPGIDVNDPMQLAKFYEELQERIETLPEEEQQQALLEAMQQLEEMQAGPTAAIGRWRDANRWGAPRAVVLQEQADGAPTLLALVYQDRALGRTGFALQWLPASSMPGRPAEGAKAEPAARQQAPAQASAQAPAMTLDEAEAFLWEGLEDTRVPEELEAYLAAFPYGAHRHEAADRIEALRAAPPDPTPEEEPAQAAQPQPAQPQATQPAQASEPQPAQQQPAAETVTTPTLTLAGAAYTAHQGIVVRFAGLTAQSGDWIGISKVGSADNSYETYAMTGGKSAGEVRLTGQFAGDYEIRAYTESPQRTVLVRLPITIGPALPVTLTPASATFAAGEPIVVRFDGMPANGDDWLGVSPPDMADGGYIDWGYTGGTAAGEVKLKGEPAGEYEIRAYADKPQRTVLARVRVIVE